MKAQGRGGKPPGLLSRGLQFQARSKQRREQQRRHDARDAGRPAKPVEQLAEDGTAEKAAAEIAGEINAARSPAIVLRRLADKTGGDSLGKKGADADQD